MNLAGGDTGALPPIAELLGVELVDAGGGEARVSFRASEWFALMYPEVAPGILGALADTALTAAIASYKDADERLVIINSSSCFLAPVPTDGRLMTAVGRVAHRRGDIITAHHEVVDADGRPVAVGQGPCMLRPVEVRSGRRNTERVLLTVLFTDIVGSTERAVELGDDKWGELLAEYQLLVRRKVDQFRGREVKTTGDGFLCTFDAPTRAVQCAQAIRDGVRRLGLEVYIGIHTGECEVSDGDLAGLAVHVASRLESAAAPGEILVSATVRDLVAGSGISLADRGPHQLKGLDGSWTLFAVEE
jgi:uncharacterized protein (TIGR00369 family)